MPQPTFASSLQQRPIRGLRLALALIAACPLLIAGCSTGSGDGLDANGRPESEGGASGPLVAEFKSIQDNILTPVCATCHSGAAVVV